MLRIPTTELSNACVKTRAALERFEEMRQLIQQRQGEAPAQPRGRPVTPVQRGQDDARIDGLEKLASDADKDLKRALSNHETLQRDLRQVNTDLKEVSRLIMFCIDTS
jgi:hypothetical protein